MNGVVLPFARAMRESNPQYINQNSVACPVAKAAVGSLSYRFVASAATRRNSCVEAVVYPYDQ
jgi:hypothetical protein